MQSSRHTMQELLYPLERDYREASPHLQHLSLHDRLVDMLRQELSHVADQGLPKTALETGAGHGGFTDYALAFGFSVTATEMSRGSVEYLSNRYRTNEKFTVIYDSDGTLEAIKDQKFSVILCISVLHHIPDYVTFIQTLVANHLAPGGSLIIMQDPLWYPSVDRFTLWLGKMGYFAWRLGKGGYLKGVKTRLRRIRGQLDLTNPDDTVEYHIVRSGVNHSAITDSVAGQFDDVRLVPYWSTQAGSVQWLGDKIGSRNTFAIIARGFRG